MVSFASKPKVLSFRQVHLSDLSTELMALKECLVFSLDPALEQWITWMLSFDVELIQSSYNLPLTSFDTL
jgi:hypothetical protein